MGYATAPEGESKAKSTLIGAGTGAAIGGLAGGLSSGGGIPVEQVRNAISQQKELDEKAMIDAVGSIMRKLRNDPEVLSDFLSNTPPEIRDQALKSLNPGWLARMFGG